MVKDLISLPILLQSLRILNSNTFLPINLNLIAHMVPARSVWGLNVPVQFPDGLWRRGRGRGGRWDSGLNMDGDVNVYGSRRGWGGRLNWIGNADGDEALAVALNDDLTHAAGRAGAGAVTAAVGAAWPFLGLVVYRDDLDRRWGW